MMQEVGKTLHMAKSGRVIIRLGESISEGDILCDSDGNRMLRVSEIIGKVDSPFASCIPMINYTKKNDDVAVYAVTSPNNSQMNNSRRKRKHY